MKLEFLRKTGRALALSSALVAAVSLTVAPTAAEAAWHGRGGWHGGGWHGGGWGWGVAAGALAGAAIASSAYPYGYPYYAYGYPYYGYPPAPGYYYGY
jgi:hypothetical protein